MFKRTVLSFACPAFEPSVEEHHNLTREARQSGQTEAKVFELLVKKFAARTGSKPRYVCYADHHKFVWWYGRQVQAKLNERFNRNIARQRGMGLPDKVILDKSMDVVMTIGDIFIRLYRTKGYPHDPPQLMATVVNF